MSGKTPTTSISHSDTHRIFVRGADLGEELIGHLTFTEMFCFELTGRRPTRGKTALLDAVMVTLMEHGLTPSAIATRLVYHSAPENLQGAVAAGLLGVDSTFIGTMEGCAALLEEIRTAPEGMPARARRWTPPTAGTSRSTPPAPSPPCSARSACRNPSCAAWP